MDWATIIGKLVGNPDQNLIDCNNYLLAENRILRRRVERRPKFTDQERITLATAAKPLGRPVLTEIATIVTPDTLLRWHRRLVEKIAPKERGKIGRPPTDAQIVERVLRFAKENPSWGYDRIAGALKELGHSISDTTVGNILRENGQLPAPDRKKGTSWADFIAAHKEVFAAGLTSFNYRKVWTLLGPVTYYVLFFINIATRKVHIAGFTRNPNESWMKQIARNLTMEGAGFLNHAKYLIIDRDGKYAPSVRAMIEAAGIEILRLPPCSPNLNAFAERFVRSIKEECLDRLILFGEPSLHRAIDQLHRTLPPRASAPGEGERHPLPGNPKSANPIHPKRRPGPV